MLTAGLGLTALLTGCGLFDGLGEDPAPAPTVAPTVAPDPGETPSGPQLVPDGSAADNLPLFAQVVAAVWESDAAVQGSAYIDALTAAGFDRAAMQVTPDTSTVNRPAESIQFSVAWGGECLVGQIGPSTGEPVTTVLPQADAGLCLLGATRPIDW